MGIGDVALILMMADLTLQLGVPPTCSVELNLPRNNNYYARIIFTSERNTHTEMHNNSSYIIVIHKNVSNLYSASYQ